MCYVCERVCCLCVCVARGTCVGRVGVYVSGVYAVGGRVYVGCVSVNASVRRSCVHVRVRVCVCVCTREHAHGLLEGSPGADGEQARQLVDVGE